MPSPTRSRRPPNSARCTVRRSPLAWRTRRVWRKRWGSRRQAPRTACSGCWSATTCRSIYRSRQRWTRSSPRCNSTRKCVTARCGSLCRRPSGACTRTGRAGPSRHRRTSCEMCWENRRAGRCKHVGAQHAAPLQIVCTTCGLLRLRLRALFPDAIDPPAHEQHAHHRECDSAVGADERERSEEHTSELQSRLHLVCRLLLEKKILLPLLAFGLTFTRRSL